MQAKSKALIFLLSTYLFSNVTWAAYVPDAIAHRSLKDIAVASLKYSLNDQNQDEKSPYYLKGEFVTKIQSTLVPVLAGVGKMYKQEDEATAFTTASVINILAQIYLDNPHLQRETPFDEIPAAIDLGISTYHRYQEGETYNFYPARYIENGIKVRRPINMTLFPLWFGFTNIPNDADTTSVVLSSLYYQNKLLKKDSNYKLKIPNEFSQFVDVNRNPNFYNRFENRRNTGGFMTWLYDEKDSKRPKAVFAHSREGARIPFKKNDVDCVVNMNVVKLFSLTKTKVSAQNQACEMINDMILKDENAKCGIYYPNTYNLAYAVASAKQLGASCVTEDNNQRLVNKILKEQLAEGNWVNQGNIWSDENLSTAFAMTALLELGDLSEARVRSALIYGVHYLIKKAKAKDGLIYWDADNFFTATALARSLIMWRSKAYSNAIITAVLLRMDALFPNYKVENYTKLKFN